MTNILEEFGWVSLKQRSKVSRHILLCKVLKGRACIPTDDIILPNMTNKNNIHWPFRCHMPGLAKMLRPITSQIQLRI